MTQFEETNRGQAEAKISLPSHLYPYRHMMLRVWRMVRRICTNGSSTPSQLKCPRLLFGPDILPKPATKNSIAAFSSTSNLCLRHKTSTFSIMSRLPPPISTDGPVTQRHGPEMPTYYSGNYAQETLSPLQQCPYSNSEHRANLHQKISRERRLTGVPTFRKPPQQTFIPQRVNPLSPIHLCYSPLPPFLQFNLPTRPSQPVR